MADTLFPKREERVPYGSGTPAKRDRKNTKGKNFRGIRKTQRKKEQATRETHFER